MINSYIGICDLNRKLLPCRKTKQRKLCEKKIVASGIVKTCDELDLGILGNQNILALFPSHHPTTKHEVLPILPIPSFLAAFCSEHIPCFIKDRLLFFMPLCVWQINAHTQILAQNHGNQKN
jgi:hypothetical protein